MTQAPFYFETRDILSLFISAFNDIVIKRYDKNQIPQSLVQVRYVYSPKERVMYDIVNKAQNLTLPVVAVNVTGITRDVNRVFNKNVGFTYPKGNADTQQRNTAIQIRTPVPVDIGISMSIVTKFQLDMDQILSNFIPYNNPYIILSWPVPPNIALPIGFAINQEIRSEVLWDGNVALTYPTDINANEKYKIVGTTSFTIKSWLFPAVQNPIGNIYYIDTNFYSTRLITNYAELTGSSYTYPLSTGLYSNLDVVNLSGYPQITNVITQPQNPAYGQIP